MERQAAGSAASGKSKFQTGMREDQNQFMRLFGAVAGAPDSGTGGVGVELPVGGADPCGCPVAETVRKSSTKQR